MKFYSSQYLENIRQAITKYGNCCIPFPFVLQIHSSAPSDDTQLIEHLKELIQEIGPYVEEETVDDAEIEDELERDSEDDQPANDDMDTS